MCEQNCSGHGKCVDGLCLCRSGYIGDSCNRVIGICPRNCTGHGACDERTATCVCDPGFTGADCGLVDSPCPRDCMGNGRCSRGLCQCKAGYSGRDCSVTCLNRCSGHGDCLNGTCYCAAGWQGDDCGLIHALTGLHAIVPSAYAWYPIGTAVFFLVAFVLLFFLGGYMFNVCSGLRGTAAIPLYLYFSSSMSGSDYTLKTG